MLVGKYLLNPTLATNYSFQCFLYKHKEITTQNYTCLAVIDSNLSASRNESVQYWDGLCLLLLLQRACTKVLDFNLYYGFAVPSFPTDFLHCKI